MPLEEQGTAVSMLDLLEARGRGVVEMMVWIQISLKSSRGLSNEFGCAFSLNTSFSGTSFVVLIIAVCKLSLEGKCNGSIIHLCQLQSSHGIKLISQIQEEP